MTMTLLTILATAILIERGTRTWATASVFAAKKDKTDKNQRGSC